MHISRNPIDEEILETNIGLNDENIRAFKDELAQENFLVVRGLERTSLENLCSAAALSYPVERQAAYLDLFIESSLAKYQMATHVGTEISVSMCGNRYQVVPADKDYLVTDQNWMLGYMAALARRKMDIVHSFCAIDLDIVRQKDGTTGGQYSQLFASFLQRLFRKGEPHGKNLLAAANRIKEDEMPAPTYDYALHVDGPLIDLFVPILSDDKEDFNAMLVQALQAHKKYWSTEPKNIPDGLLSLPITALAVMARDYGFPIDHTSDYLLQFLVDE